MNQKMITVPLPKVSLSETKYVMSDFLQFNFITGFGLISWPCEIISQILIAARPNYAVVMIWRLVQFLPVHSWRVKATINSLSYAVEE